MIKSIHFLRTIQDYWKVHGDDALAPILAFDISEVAVMHEVSLYNWHNW